jgi:hypothetical protein
MAEPKGKIIARPMEARACGCLQEFQHYAVDRFRAQRLAKFQKTRCAGCVAKLVEEERRAAEALPKKGEAIKALPLGTQIILTLGADGTWAGTLTAEGKTIKVTAGGPQGVTVALARLWLTTRGSKPI